ncbi:hypothetical protein YPPY16_2649, partial [Yersinia pestis PY-16]
MFCGGGAPP